MMLIDVGFGNYVSAERIITVATVDSMPIRRLVQDAKNVGRVIDVSSGKKTKSVILTDSEHLILSAEETEILAQKINSAKEE